jgi:hypothetical protein
MGPRTGLPVGLGGDLLTMLSLRLSMPPDRSQFDSSLLLAICPLCHSVTAPRLCASVVRVNRDRRPYAPIAVRTSQSSGNMRIMTA